MFTEKYVTSKFVFTELASCFRAVVFVSLTQPEWIFSSRLSLSHMLHILSLLVGDDIGI